MLLDLHSFQGQGKPFAMLGPRNNDGGLEPFSHEIAEGRLAACVGTERIVEGWLSTYALGLQRRAAKQNDGSRQMALQQDTHYGVGNDRIQALAARLRITLECGQHQDPDAPEFAYRAILRAMVLLGLLAQEVVEPRPATQPELLQLYEVIDRNDAGDAFEQPWASFDPVVKGQRIGTRASGEPVLHRTMAGSSSRP